MAFMCTASIVDCQVRIGGAAPTFQAGSLTLRGIPVEDSYWELRNSNFWLQMVRTISCQTLEVELFTAGWYLSPKYSCPFHFDAVTWRNKRKSNI